MREDISEYSAAWFSQVIRRSEHGYAARLEELLDERPAIHRHVGSLILKVVATRRSR
ncbi:MAG: hypothetical protein ACYC2K_18575 [Gemmatimonadales bacterium]